MKKKKNIIFTFVFIFIMITGIAITTTNAYKLLAGYFLYKFNNTEITSASAKGTQTPAKQENRITPLYTTAPKMGEEMGELYIPKLEAKLPIFQGTDEDELAKGVGHYANSVLPGEKDNSVLAGHRDTVFRRLGQVGKGDLLVVTTTAGKFVYKVKKVRIVDKEDRSVIVPKPAATLTVSTCYPFSFIGQAPKRYILVAYLLKSQLSNESLPSDS